MSPCSVFSRGHSGRENSEKLRGEQGGLRVRRCYRDWCGNSFLNTSSFFYPPVFFSRSNIASPRQAIPATTRIKSVAVGSALYITRMIRFTFYLYPRANNLVNLSSTELKTVRYILFFLRLCFRGRNNIASTRQTTATTTRIGSMTFTFYL
jgi:hypothetical protein